MTRATTTIRRSRPTAQAIDGLLGSGKPFLAVCLGHQVLCDRLGIALDYKDIVFQGTQSSVEIDGREERVGFYNTFVGRLGEDDAPGRRPGRVRPGDRRRPPRRRAELPRRAVPRRVDPHRERLRPAAPAAAGAVGVTAARDLAGARGRPLRLLHLEPRAPDRRRHRRAPRRRRARRRRACSSGRAAASHVVLSPGPGHPEDEADFALGPAVFELGVPVLGVCLGMQALVTSYGGTVDRVDPATARSRSVDHDQEPACSRECPSPFEAVRYHSLAAAARARRAR